MINARQFIKLLRFIQFDTKVLLQEFEDVADRGELHRSLHSEKRRVNLAQQEPSLIFVRLLVDGLKDVIAEI